MEPALGLSLAQVAARRWLDAERTVRSVLDRDPLNLTALGRLAFVQYQLGRYRAAEATYRAALAAYPSDIEMQCGLGWALLRQERAATAAKVFQRVLMVAPHSGSAKAGLDEAS